MKFPLLLRLVGTLLNASLLAATEPAANEDSPRPQPNILWITSEDHGIEMGCYGDAFATTPHVDQLATQGLTYRFAWSNAPVCAAARTTLITGVYPTSTGSEHMRSRVPFPAGIEMYPQLLRKAGYYCTNNAKEDYNLNQPGRVWDISSPQAHWRDRPANQPFFAIFNSTVSHEHAIRTRPHSLVHDPAQVRVPAYHPDTPEVRHDWAQYYDSVSEADTIAGDRLAELAAAGLTDDTIVFYYGDHGSGMPRSKRWPGNSGLRVPLVVYIPQKFRDLRPPEYTPGGMSDRLVSFVDFAPTLLSLAGVKPPAWMQGHAFLGRYDTPPQPFLFGFRGRMDERYDLVRTVTDGRFVYLRNYLPFRPAGQHIAYQFRTDTTRIWWQLHEAHALSPEQDAFWHPRAPEELYDLQTDPDEVHNLADSREYQEIKARLRTAQQAQARATLDVGFLPEGELHHREPGVSPYAFARDPGVYPFERIFATAELASLLDPAAIPELVQRLSDTDNTVRYWAVLGLLMRKSAGGPTGRDALRVALHDSSPDVRIAAAETLALYGSPADRTMTLDLLAQAADPTQSDALIPMAALNAIDDLGPIALPIRPILAAYAAHSEQLPPDRYLGYLQNLLARYQPPAASDLQ
ncbi:sulfatase-like hydrolase/transferase [Synoicihabitans lomoniglobus]|uniref:Sulfatase-like hydrolase/transferase n=1 Tax=Synoicihabitans lomoniglobus TaxID=2909285 RepID=A0AAE9ZUA1_9BACT|nr:sulfatase-like hydrolase/transferase [Opitutaceae bacterium LMO-M01]WED63189.1 sulfatase-like hydrolase/transferase [Opitutaceae bacterium LMO-M01]